MDVAVKIGSQAEIMLDLDERNDGPPCLCIQSGPVQLLLYPMGWSEFGAVTACDLDRANDLVREVMRWRDAISTKLERDRQPPADDAHPEAEENAEPAAPAEEPAAP